MSDRPASGSGSHIAQGGRCLRLSLREANHFSQGKYNGSKPVSCVVIGNKLGVGKKWGDLYANLIEFLLEHGFLTDDYSYFQGTEPTQRSYRASNGLWVGINLSCDDSVKRIRSLVEESGISFNDIRITYHHRIVSDSIRSNDVVALDSTRSFRAVDVPKKAKAAAPGKAKAAAPSTGKGKISEVRLNQVKTKSFSGTIPVSLQISGISLSDGGTWQGVLVRLIDFLLRRRLIRQNHKLLQPKDGSDNQLLRINGRVINVCVHGNADEIVKRRLYTLVRDARIRPDSVVIRYITDSCNSGRLHPRSSLNSQVVLPKSANNKLDDVTQVEQVLEKHFIKGFRLGSMLEMRKFKRFYEDDSGVVPYLDEDKIERIIQSIGIIHNSKVYLPKTMLSAGVKKKLFDYIQEEFDSGKAYIYYDALFNVFSDDFLDCYIYDANMLRSYLAVTCCEKYVIGKEQLFNTEKFLDVAASDPLHEVRACLKKFGGPMETEQLCSVLSHLPETKILKILSSNREFVRTRRGEYFHADDLALSDSQLEDIATLIEDNLRSQTYLSGTELMNSIRQKYPAIYEGYSSYSDIGWRDALRYKFQDRFSFQGNIITQIGTELSMSDAFGERVASSERISLDEIRQFAKEMGSTRIYFEPVYEHAIRINEDTFVSKKSASFKIKETDSILDRFCSGNYTSLPSINDFYSFPEAGFVWTPYLLESYVKFYSERYTLLHNGFNLRAPVGAIVKSSAGYGCFDDLLVDVIADSDFSIEQKGVLDYLVRKGYIARRSYDGIEDLLIRARIRRNNTRGK